MMINPGIHIIYGDGKERFHPVEEPGLYILNLIRISHNYEKIEETTTLSCYFETPKQEEVI